MDTTSTPQQEISTETTPAQDTATPTTSTQSNVPQSTQAAKPEATVTSESENWEYTGDRKAVPSEFEKYVKGLDRYVSKKDQAAAELRKKAEEYEHFVNSDSYKQYQQFIAQQPKNTGSQAQPQAPTITPEEHDAILMGDANTLNKVIERQAKKIIEESVGPQAAVINQKFQAIEQKERQIESAEMIQSFAEVHPDFWDLYDNGLEEYVIQSVKSGRSLEDTYKAAKQIEDKMTERLETKRKADIEKKKAGSVVGKSIPGTPDVVYADNEDQAKRLAIELTLKGDKRHVRIKPKK